MTGSEMNEAAAVARIRIDKWLWHARFFKSRTLAAKVVADGKLRINREVVRKPGHVVRPGDILTFAKNQDIRVIEIVAMGERRGPASEAQDLYRDLSPPEAKRPLDRSAVGRPRGAGRPTKRDRRAIDRLLDGSG